MKKVLFSLGNLPITTYALLAAILCLLAGASLLLIYKKNGWKKRWAAAYTLSAALLSLFLGRLVYCIVRYNSLFFDPMGRKLGIAPFFQLSVGSISSIGVIAGCLAAGWIIARLMRISPAAHMDALCLPGMLLFAAMRFAEPLSGQGFGPMVASPLLSWAPLSIKNGWGGWMISICFIEGLLAMGISLYLLPEKKGKQGEKALIALLLLAASQLIPESLRRDDALKIFTFARINQIGFAALFFACCIAVWIKVKSGKRAAIQAPIILLIMGLLIFGEYALDKTQWPDGLIYAGMILLTLVMTGIMLLPLKRKKQ